MDKKLIEEFVLELIEEVGELSQSYILEHSGKINEDLEELKVSIQGYKNKLNDLLK